MAPKTRQAQPDANPAARLAEPDPKTAAVEDPPSSGTREAIKAIVERYRETFERLGR